MQQKIKVYKFGGTSIKDSESIKNVVEILKNHKGEPILIVVSAKGKTTNALEEVVKIHSTNEYEKAVLTLDQVKAEHYKLINEFFDSEHEIYANVNDLFVEAEWALEEEPDENYDYLYDQIVSVGELVSSKIIAAILNDNDLQAQWVDARDVILTNNDFRSGTVQWEETQDRIGQHINPAINPSNFVVTQGFIGSTSENFTTTLGREGSDYSAAIFANCLNAESLTLWKDVPGVLSDDPKLVKDAKKIDRLSFDEAAKIINKGAKVIHYKTFKPLRDKKIPLRVKSFILPKEEGTLIA